MVKAVGCAARIAGLSSGALLRARGSRNEISSGVVDEEILDNGPGESTVILYQDFLYSMAACEIEHKYLKRSRERATSWIST